MHGVRPDWFSDSGSWAARRPGPRSHAAGLVGAAVLAVVLLVTGCSDSPERPDPPASSGRSATDGAVETVVHVRTCENRSAYAVPTDDPIPDSVRLPSPLTLPRGAAVAGIRAGRGDAVQYILGPETGTCHFVFGASSIHFFMGADDGRSGVSEAFAPAGAAYSSVYGCEYLPEVARLSPGADCTKPPDEEVTPLSTGVRNLHASLVRVQAGSSSYLWGRDSRYDTVALFVSTVTQGNPAGKSISCSLPDRQGDICTASLSYFLAQVGEASHLTERDRRRLTQVIHTFITDHRE